MAGGLKIVFGAASFRVGMSNFNNAEAAKDVLAVLSRHGVTAIDTAHWYGASEQILGDAGAGSSGQFSIDTKWIGGAEPASLSPERLRADAEASLRKLGVSSIDVFYIHVPPPDSVAPESYLPAIDALHRAGVFARFGLSNFLPAQVRRVHAAARAGGWVLPTVYQGNYSAVARRADAELLPLLRELGFAFHAYSPLAGGFLAKTSAQVEQGEGRFGGQTLTGTMYRSLYGKPAYLEALREWERIAADEGCSRAELANRWVSYNSPLSAERGDAIIVGASRLEQLEETLEGLKKGPLKESTAKAIDAIWEMVKHEAPVDNWHSFMKENMP